jgi:hypothetical protein
MVSGEDGFGKRAAVLRSAGVLGAMAAAHAVGRYMSPGVTVLAYRPFFVPRVYGAFLIFGLGSGLLAFAVTLCLLFRRGLKAPAPRTTWFWITGAVAAAIPFAFYTPFMFSTRHWTVLLVGLVIFTTSDQAGELYALISRRISRVVTLLLVLVAVLPLFAGLRLPFPSRPRLTSVSPTLFPTADGRSPMGGILGFMFSDRRLDHNHATWSAARDVATWQQTDGLVPLADCPLESIVRLAVRLQGLSPLVIGTEDEPPFLYVPCRSLLKQPRSLDSGRTLPGIVESRPESLAVAGGQFPTGIALVMREVQAEHPPTADLGTKVAALRHAFQGNEFRWIGSVAPGEIPLDQDSEGHSLGILSSEPFTVTGDSLTRASQCVRPWTGAEIHVLSLSGRETYGRTLRVSAPAWAAVSVYPDYMRIQRLPQ